MTGSFTKLPISDYWMSHITGTDVWYVTVKLPSDVRFDYGLLRFSPGFMASAPSGGAIWRNSSMAKPKKIP